MPRLESARRESSLVQASCGMWGQDEGYLVRAAHQSVIFMDIS
jgi:hypothetical protein